MFAEDVTEMKVITKVENSPLEFSVQIFWNFPKFSFKWKCLPQPISKMLKFERRIRKFLYLVLICREER